MQKIIIIGSNSFSGSSFVDFILTKKFRVIGVSRSNEYKDVFLKYKKNKNIKNFKFQKLDINKDFNKLCALIKKERPDTMKGELIKNVYLTSTMGISYKVGGKL